VTDPGSLAAPVTRLIVWRHGRTDWNAVGRFQGQMDPPLDEEGRNQAARAAAYLLATGLTADDTVVVSSDLSRAAETAATLTALLGVPLHLDQRLREHGLGAWEGLTRDEVAASHPDQYADWIAGRPVHGRGGEDAADVTRRALAALADLPPSDTAVIVTHGGTAGRLLEALLGLGADHRRVFGPLGNCAWSELVRQSDRWRLLRHNNWVGPVADERPAAEAVPALRAVPPLAGSADGEGAAAATPDERPATPEGDADAVF
jgi:glucosyl-3-phosphoglycerate phosphatase